jgi:hypothetical protein
MTTFAIKEHRETLIGRYVMCPIRHISTPASKYCKIEPEPSPRYKYHPGWIIATAQDFRDNCLVAYIEDERGTVRTSRLDGLIFDDENHSQYLAHVRMADLMWADEQIAQRKAVTEKAPHD